MAREVPWLDTIKGVYYVKWYDHDTRQTMRRSLRTSDANVAQREYAAFLNGGFKPRKKGEQTVADVLDDYLREHVRRECAAAFRQEVSAEHLKKFFPDKLIHEIDIPACRAYADARRRGQVSGCGYWKRGVADATIRRELNVLSAAANHAIKWRRLPASDAPSVELPKAQAAEKHHYTEAEVEMLINAASGDLKEFIRITYYTGARRGSVETLETSQVDFVGKRIHLDKPGAKKTKKRRPIVPMFKAIEPGLKTLVAKAEDGWLFGKRADFYKPYRELCELLGLENKAHPHLLRHSRATHLLQRGKGIYDVARLLGDTVDTVERVYGHHSPEYLAETLED